MNKFIFLILLLGWASVYSQGMPFVQSVAKIDLQGIGVFELFPDSQGKQILYVRPANLKIAKGPDGNPMIRVILLKEIASPAQSESPAKIKASGYIWLSVYLGYDKEEELFTKLRQRIEMMYPQYKGWNLTSLSLMPGTGKIGYSIGNSAEIVWVPFSAPTTIGTQIPVMIPIPKEHGEIIRQTLLHSPKATSNDLGIAIYYQADALFMLPPTRIWVKAEKSEMFKYVHETLKTKGGFFIFSWSYHREKIREELERRQILKGGIDGKQPYPEAILNLFQEMKSRAIDFTAEIRVDPSRKAPDDSFERREGRFTIFGAWYFWTFTAWAGGAYGTTDIEKKATGVYDEEYNFTGHTQCPVSMTQENLALDSSVIMEVDLENAFYVTDVLVAEPFFNSSVWGKAVQSAKIVVKIGSEDSSEQLVFHFNPNRSSAQASAYWRNTKFQWDGPFLKPQLPPLFVRTELTTQHLRLSTPLQKYECRSIDKFMPAVVELQQFYDLVKIDGELLFADVKIKRLQVQYLRPGIIPGSETLTLSPEQQAVFAVYDKSKGLSNAVVRVRVVTTDEIGPWSNPRDVSGETEIILTKKDIR